MFDPQTLKQPLIDEILAKAPAADRRGRFGRACQVLGERGELRREVQRAVEGAVQRARTDVWVQDYTALADTHEGSWQVVAATLLAWSVAAMVSAAGLDDESWRDQVEHLRGDPRVVAAARALGASETEAATAYIRGADDDGFYYLVTADTRQDALARAATITPLQALARFERQAREQAEPVAPPPRPSVPWGGLDFDLDEFNGDLREALALAFPEAGPVHEVKGGARVKAALAAWDDATNGGGRASPGQRQLALALEALQRAEVALGEADEQLREARRTLGLGGSAGV